ncbi:unnamed protein product [Boreogadus saida]
MVKPQSQHSGGRGVEQAGCSYAGDGEASWTAPGVSSSPAGQQRFQGDDDGRDLNPCLQISVEIRCASTTSGDRAVTSLFWRHVFDSCHGRGFKETMMAGT